MPRRTPAPECWAIVAGGGTAGHVLPGLAVARVLTARGHPAESIHFVGSTRGLEARLVPEAGFPVTLLPGRGIQRRLTLDELRGGTCTITNIGPLGGVFATPIINQPELAIVGLHRIQDRPAVVEGEIVVRKMMYLSVSFDHRWIDGANGARFMTDFARLVSNPGMLMVRL